MPEMHQPSSDPTEPDTVEPTAADETGDVPPVLEGGEELSEVAGGGEITDIGPDSPAS
jgi:hypothetical protein